MTSYQVEYHRTISSALFYRAIPPMEHFGYVLAVDFLVLDESNIYLTFLQFQLFANCLRDYLTSVYYNSIESWT